MAWSNSSIFRQYVADLVQGTVENQGTTSMDWVEATTVKAALYGTTPTPDNDVAAANTAYAVGQWVVGNEITDGTNWDVAGEPITARTVGVGTADTIIMDGADTPQSGATTTLAAVFGCLVYSDSITTPVADQGYCFNYFGGSQSVTAGTFTIVWNASGIFRFTVTAA
jgi:hypothetical protein